MSANRKLRYGMIGGGRGAFIGGVHRIAAIMDGQAVLTAGAFSSDPERSRASGEDLFLDPSRVYGSYQEMAKAEAKKPADERLDFIVIVTPNHQHFPPAKLFLESGFNVVCDKPVTFNLAEAKKLRVIVKKSKKVFVLTHNYTGNAMVKQARELVQSGYLGEIRKVVSEYPQGWLSTHIEASGQKQAAWRTDPKRSGAAGCIGDIGTHAENLARYITGLHIDSICADLSTFVKGRALDDDGNILVRFKGGAKGIIHASQISVGDENNLNIRVYGTKAAIEWHQEHPNQTSWWLNTPTSRRKFGGAATATSARPRPGSHAFPRAIPRAISRRLPTSTARPSARFAPRWPANRCRRISIFRPLRTASRAWRLSRRRSAVPRWVRVGSSFRRRDGWHKKLGVRR
jgi:predicted dehydrogenase